MLFVRGQETVYNFSGIIEHKSYTHPCPPTTNLEITPIFSCRQTVVSKIKLLLWKRRRISVAEVKAVITSLTNL